MYSLRTKINHSAISNITLGHSIFAQCLFSIIILIAVLSFHPENWKPLIMVPIFGLALFLEVMFSKLYSETVNILPPFKIWSLRFSIIMTFVTFGMVIVLNEYLPWLTVILRPS